MGEKCFVQFQSFGKLTSFGLALFKRGTELVILHKTRPMKNWILTLALAILSTGAVSAQKGNTETVIMEVKGVCGMCKDRIEEAANMSKGVKSSSWDKETHKLTVTFNPKKTSPEEIGKALAEVGHDNEYVMANDKQYGKIHKCCRYREGHVH